MKRFALIIALAALLAYPTFVFAQVTLLEVENMQIDVWPEYDRTEPLVIYRFSLSSAVKLPAQVTVRIPRQANQPYNVAMQDVDGMLYNLNYSSVAEGDWLKISFTAPTTNLQVEYYDPRMTKTAPQRNYEFRWPGDFRVKNMVFRVMQPVNASQMQILPTSGTPSKGQDGLTYYTNQVGTVEAGVPFTFKISYSKSDDTFSYNPAAVQPQQPVSTGQPAKIFSGQNGLILLIGMVAAAILIGGGLVWFMRLRQAEQPVASRRRHAAQPASREPVTTAIYCHQCGKRAGAGDVFCRSCGTRLRSEQ